MILRSHFTGLLIGLMALAASFNTGCPKSPRPATVQLHEIAVPPDVFSISGEVVAVRATGEAGRSARVQQSVDFLRTRFGNFQRAVLYEFNINGQRLSQRLLQVSGEGSVSFTATTGNSYLIYADLGERFRNSYRLACRASRLAIGGTLAPKLCEQIFCTRDTFRVSQLNQRLSGLSSHPGLSAFGEGLVGGFGNSGEICARCLDSSFYPVDECSQSLTLPPITHHAPTPERIDGPPEDADTIRIVSMGDSYASGEGAPDVNASDCDLRGVTPDNIPDCVVCADRAQWKASDKWNEEHAFRRVPSADERCHRSTNSGPRQAADTWAGIVGVPVEFVSLACSGARVGDLIGSNAAGGSRGNGVIEVPTPCSTPAPAIPLQLEQAEQLFPNRQRIDVLILGIGGNDVGFAQKVRDCLLMPLCPPPKLPQPGTPPPEKPPGQCYFCSWVGTGDNDPEKLARDLSARYDRLAAVIRNRLNVGTVLITEYPNPMFKDDGSICSEEPAGDPLMGLQWDEAKWAAETVIPTLNRTVKEAAARNGWHYVGGVANGFMGHGYCASAPYLNTFRRSFEIEGQYSGAVHPNVEGYRVYRDAILGKLRELEPAILADMHNSIPPTPTIVINRPNALNESTLVTRNHFYIAWDIAAPNFTSVRVAYRHREERDWRINTFSVNRQSPSQRFPLAATGTIDFAVSVCVAGRCSRWSKPVRASNELETFAAPETLRLTSLTETLGIPGQITIAKFNLSFAWDAPLHLSLAKYHIAVVHKGRWSYESVDDPTATAAGVTVFAGDGVYDAWIRQCAPKIWSQTEAGPVSCSPWSSGLRFAAPNVTPSIPTLSIEEVSDRVKPFTVKWQVASANQAVSQLAYVTKAGEDSYSFFQVSGEQTEYSFATQPMAVRVRACNQAGCSGWSNDVYDPAHSPESLNAAPIPVSRTPSHIVPP